MQVPRIGRRAALTDDGFGILELVVAIALFAIIATALASTAGSGLRLVTTSSSRQTATQIAVEELELLRSDTFEELGHAAALTQSADPDNPDADVAADGLSYTVPGVGAAPLAVDPLLTTTHGPESMTRGGTRFSIYRYVTEIDDTATSASPDAKRATVVIQWEGSAAPNEFSMSSSYSPGSIEWTTPAGPVTPPPPGPPTPPPPTPPSGCADSATPDITMAILAQTGAEVGYTSTSSVTLHVQIVSEDCPKSELRVWVAVDGGSAVEADNFCEAADEPCGTGADIAWPIPNSNGDHTVSVFVRDASGKSSATHTDTVRLDATAPGIPTSFDVVKAGSSTKYAKVTWQGTADNDNLIGYRVYRRVGNTGSYTVMEVIPAGAGLGKCNTNAACGYDDFAVNAGVTYEYFVAAYDAAGNETKTDAKSVKI